MIKVIAGIITAIFAIIGAISAFISIMPVVEHNFFKHESKNITIVATRLIPNPALFSSTDFRDTFRLRFLIKNIDTTDITISSIKIKIDGNTSIKWKTRSGGDNTILSNNPVNNKYITLKPGEETWIGYDEGIELPKINQFLINTELNNQDYIKLKDEALIQNLDWVTKLEKVMKKTYGENTQFNITIYSGTNWIYNKSIPITKAGTIFNKDGLIYYDTLLGDSHFQLIEDQTLPKHWK